MVPNQRKKFGLRTKPKILTKKSWIRIYKKIKQNILKFYEEIGAGPYWMAIQFDREYYSVYFGHLACFDKKKDIPVVKCELRKCSNAWRRIV